LSIARLPHDRNILGFNDFDRRPPLCFSTETMIIRLTPEDAGSPEVELAGGGLQLTEVLEGADEFLDAIVARLNEIVRKPSGRFVISYVEGHPGSRRPPKVQ
jgi:hypothetical protein